MKEGDKVTVFLEGVVCSGVFKRYGRYIGLDEKRVHVKFIEKKVDMYYKKDEFLELLKEYKRYVRNLLL
jgi:poly(A) polymerase Pap1